MPARRACTFIGTDPRQAVPGQRGSNPLMNKPSNGCGRSVTCDDRDISNRSCVMKLFCPLVCCFVCFALTGAEKDSRKPATSSRVTYRCQHIAKGQIHIDGKADEPAWQRAQP